MKKFFALFIAGLALAALVGCGGKTDDSAETSKLIGTFTASESITSNDIFEELRIYGSEAEAINGDLWCDVYPFQGPGSRVSYNYDQRLQLKRNFTYVYQYSITLGNKEEWGKDFASISILMEGKFSYEQTGPDQYTVKLENPYAGTQTVNGATASRLADVYGWSMSSSPTYIEDVEAELALDENYAYNRYLIGREVSVNKGEKTVTDDIFYSDVMNDIALYSDYIF